MSHRTKFARLLVRRALRGPILVEITMHGKTVRDVPADMFVEALAEHFKNNDKIQVPAFASIVKTAAYKELPPLSADWYYTRAAAIARRVYMRGGSVGGFAKAFGGKDRRGAKRNRSALASRGISRKILQQLESIDYLAVHEDGGRKLTKNGQRELDIIAKQIELPTGLQL